MFKIVIRLICALCFVQIIAVFISQTYAIFRFFSIFLPDFRFEILLDIVFAIEGQRLHFLPSVFRLTLQLYSCTYMCLIRIDRQSIHPRYVMYRCAQICGDLSFTVMDDCFIPFRLVIDFRIGNILSFAVIIFCRVLLVRVFCVLHVIHLPLQPVILPYTPLHAFRGIFRAKSAFPVAFFIQHSTFYIFPRNSITALFYINSDALCRSVLLCGAFAKRDLHG